MNNKQTALLVVDMQADYIGENSKNDYYSPTLIDLINERIALAVTQNETVIYVRNKGRRNKEVYISPFAEHLNVVSDFIIDKERASVFHNDSLQQLLKERQIQQIEVVGIDGNCCVASSAIDAAVLGFSVTIPLKYVGMKSTERFERTKIKLAKANVNLVSL